MKKVLLLAGLSAVVIAGTAIAKITKVNDYGGLNLGDGTATSCSDLGANYLSTKPSGASCQSKKHNGLTCYYDCSCGTQYSYTTSSCSSAGGQTGSSCTVNGVTKYTCHCPSGYLSCAEGSGIGTECTADGGKKYASCVSGTECQLGMVVFSDGNCYEGDVPPEGVTAMAVSLGNGLAVGLDEGNYAWQNGGDGFDEIVAGNPFEENSDEISGEYEGSDGNGALASTIYPAWMERILKIFDVDLVKSANATVTIGGYGNSQCTRQYNCASTVADSYCAGLTQPFCSDGNSPKCCPSNTGTSYSWDCGSCIGGGLTGGVSSDHAANFSTEGKTNVNETATSSSTNTGTTESTTSTGCTCSSGYVYSPDACYKLTNTCMCSGACCTQQKKTSSDCSGYTYDSCPSGYSDQGTCCYYNGNTQVTKHKCQCSCGSQYVSSLSSGYKWKTPSSCCGCDSSKCEQQKKSASDCSGYYASCPNGMERDGTSECKYYDGNNLITGIKCKNSDNCPSEYSLSSQPSTSTCPYGFDQTTCYSGGQQVTRYKCKSCNYAYTCSGGKTCPNGVQSCTVNGVTKCVLECQCVKTGCSNNTQGEERRSRDPERREGKGKAPSWSRSVTDVQSHNGEQWDCDLNSQICDCDTCGKTNVKTIGTATETEYGDATCEGDRQHPCVKGLLFSKVSSNLEDSSEKGKLTGLNNTMNLLSVAKHSREGKVVVSGKGLGTISFPAAEHCSGKGKNWFLPTVGDLKALIDSPNIAKLNQVLSKNGKVISTTKQYLSSTQACEADQEGSVKCNKAVSFSKGKIENVSRKESNTTRCFYAIGK